MASIITGRKGQLAYHRTEQDPYGIKAFDMIGNFNCPMECAFAGLSVFASNSNHPPSRPDLSNEWDAGLDLLFRIAGAR